MSQSSKSIYASTSEKTYRENFTSFLSYVSESEGKDKTQKEGIYNERLNEMTAPGMKTQMIEYHNQVSKAGIFTNKQAILEETLLKMHYHEALGVTKSPQFAEALMNDKNFRKYTIADEAKNLLSGSKLYSMEISAKETKDLRETIVTQDKQINDLSGKLSKVNKALNNVVANLKQKFGFTEDKISDLLKEPAPVLDKEIKASQINKVSNKGQGMSM